MTEQETITLVKNLFKQAGRPLDELTEFPGSGIIPASTLVGVFNPTTRKLNKVAVSRLLKIIGTGGDAVFPADEPNTATPIGNLPANSVLANRSILDVFREAGSKAYEFPQFTSFLREGQGDQVVRIGTSYPAGFKSFTWATSFGSNVTANSITLRDVTANTQLASAEANDGVLSASTAAFSAVKGESRRYRISGVNSKGEAFSRDLTITGRAESFYGFSTATTLDFAGILNLGNAVLQDGKGRTISGVTASGGNYLYYAYDAANGDLSNVILDGAAPVLGAFTKLGDFTGQNAAGGTVTVRLYRSNSTNAFSNNTLAFS